MSKSKINFNYLKKDDKALIKELQPTTVQVAKLQDKVKKDGKILKNQRKI